MKIPKQEYTTEFKDLAVKRIKEGLTVGAAAKELGLVEQTLRNWVKAAESGKLNGAGAKPVTPEQMALSHLRAENVRLKQECAILKRATAYFAQRGTVKYAWIDVQRGFDLSQMCSVLERVEARRQT